jgi:D-alanyl-D-alanine carboxypeptidase/D-alanyl-D-alanine-endopeptidase (penicillin-binding protein 4)
MIDRSRGSFQARRAGLKACTTIVIVGALSPRFPAARSATDQSLRPASAVAKLKHDIDAILRTPAFERGWVGVVVRSVATEETLYELNAHKLMMPASTLKVVTLAAAGERLGWDYAYETRIVADGPVQGDRLDGNLVIVGSGDPSLERPALDAWTSQIKSLGIARVTGMVLADARRFRGAGLGFGWSWDDVPYYYAAPIAAAQFHENAVEVMLRPGSSPGAPMDFVLTPPGISGLQVENRVYTGAAAATAEFVARRAPDSPSVVLEGVLPAGSRGEVHALSVNDPVRYLAAAFTEALLAGGVALGGPPPIDDTADLARDYSGASPLITHHSAPLRVLARRLMEVSQNQYAETLIKTIGAQDGTPTFEGGLRRVESILGSWGIAPDAAILRDGSGLSRYDYVAPEALVQVLDHVYRDPVLRAPFFSSLNVAGQSGTLAARLKNTAAAGNAHAKDGTMAGVRSLCGLVNTAEDEPLVFAILANNFAASGPTVSSAIDAIVARLASFRRSTGREVPRRRR